MIKKKYQSNVPIDDLASVEVMKCKLRLVIYSGAYMDMNKNYPKHYITYIQESFNINPINDTYEMILTIEFSEKKEIN